MMAIVYSIPEVDPMQHAHDNTAPSAIVYWCTECNSEEVWQETRHISRPPIHANTFTLGALIPLTKVF